MPYLEHLKSFLASDDSYNFSEDANHIIDFHMPETEPTILLMSIPSTANHSNSVYFFF